MRTAPAAVKTWLAANSVAWRAELYTLTLLSGSVYRWTTADLDLVVSGNTFRTAGANGPLIERSQSTQRARLQIDTVDVRLYGTAFAIGGKSLQLNAAQGLFDGARLQIDQLVGNHPSHAISLGPIPSWFEGRVAEVEPVAQGVRLRVKSELEALNVLLPKFTLQPICGHAVYDAGCTLSRAAFTLSGTVSAASSASSFTTATAAVTAKTSGYFNLGVVTFTSGSLNGQKQAIAAWSGTTFTMQLPFTATPGVGDSFTVYPGCPRDKATCNTKFSNLVNFRGFPHVPAGESAK